MELTELDKMRILDLWSGTGSATKVWREAGHEVITVDNDPAFNPTICKDILDVTVEELRKYGDYHFIWASPDCRVYSVASGFSNWKKDDLGFAHPITKKSYEANKRLSHTMYLIHSLRPKYWILENPRGMMRKVKSMNKYTRHTVSYCKYRDNRMKPTDLWGVFPPNFIPKMCRNHKFDYNGEVINRQCHHEIAQRGDKTGTQGLKKVDRSKIPFDLTLELYGLIKYGGIIK